MITYHHKARAKRIAKTIHQCPGCNQQISEQNPITIDHVWPTSRGGIDHTINYELICQTCNMTKGNILPTISRIKALSSACITTINQYKHAKVEPRHWKLLVEFERILHKWTLKKDNHVVK